ncbi:MAG: glutaredoxin domain-containing protein [Acidobacteriota bacterium]
MFPAQQVDLAATRAATRRVEGTRKTITNHDLGRGRGPVTVVQSKDLPPLQLPKERKRTPSVTVYSATWCPACQRLKGYLRRKGVSANFIETDQLSKSARRDAYKEMKRLAGANAAYPTVVIGDQVVVGFDVARIQRLLDS